MAKKISKGQINFFRVMAVIGIVVIIIVVKEFLNAAPALPQVKFIKALHLPKPA